MQNDIHICTNINLMICFIQNFNNIFFFSGTPEYVEVQVYNQIVFIKRWDPDEATS